MIAICTIAFLFFFGLAAFIIWMIEGSDEPYKSEGGDYSRFNNNER